MSRDAFVIERNRCDCHPETCCCPEYNLLMDGVVISRNSNRQELQRVIDRIKEFADEQESV